MGYTTSTYTHWIKDEPLHEDPDQVIIDAVLDRIFSWSRKVDSKDVTLDDCTFVLDDMKSFKIDMKDYISDVKCGSLEYKLEGLTKRLEEFTEQLAQYICYLVDKLLDYQPIPGKTASLASLRS